MDLDLKNLPSSEVTLQKIILQFHQVITTQQQTLLAQQEELISYKEKYARLIEEIRLSKQQRFSPTSEKSAQSDLFDEAGIELDDEVKDSISDEIHVNGHTRKKHPVRQKLPLDIPRETIVHDLPEEEKHCDCGAQLAKIGEEVTEQLKYIPAKLTVLQHVRYKWACKPCQENVKIAAMPVLLLPKSIATPELVAHTLVSKYVDHIPLYRQQAIWQRLDIHLPRNSLCGWVIKVAELCEPLVALLRENIVKNSYVQADETPVQVLQEIGRANTTKSTMWAYKGGGIDHPSIVFEYQETRGGQHPQYFLRGFQGFLQSDAYSGYNFVEKDPGITHVGCMAHARRPFAQLAKLAKQTGTAHDSLKYFRQLYAIEKTAKEQQLSSEQRYALRQQHAPPILEKLKFWLQQRLTTTPAQHKLGQAIGYALTHWQTLTSYLHDGRIEIDNNAIENLIRPFAIGRKNWLFMGSPAGAKAGATLYSLIATCKGNHVEPYTYFVHILHRIRLCKTQDDYRELLPQHVTL